MNLNENISRLKKLMGVIKEEKLPDNARELIKSLPKELKEILFKQWGAKQNPTWHPEGNTLKHILVVINRAYRHYPDDPNMIMAALFHDLGKMDTYKINPKTNQPTAYGHEFKSEDYVEKFRDWLSSIDGVDVDQVKYLVKNHMKIKPRTWEVMKDTKKEPIMSNPFFDKLMGFTDKLDGGGLYEQKSKGWGNSKDKLEKTFKFDDFNKAIDFVNKVSEIAEKQNHHPNITINYNKVKLSITDHERGEVSEKCHKFTIAVDKL